MLPKVDASGRLADKVAALLLEEIASGRLQPGDKLPTEPQLVEQLGVSRTVVREAITSLRNSGMVESKHGVGVFVLPPRPQPLDLAPETEMSITTVLDILEVRRSVESTAAQLAAKRADPAARKRIREAFEAIDRAVRSGGDGVDEDLAFHAAIAAATGNPVLMSTLTYLGDVMRGGIRVSRARESQRSDHAAQVRAEHQQLLQAIEAGDARAAGRAATNHLKHAERRLKS